MSFTVKIGSKEVHGWRRGLALAPLVVLGLIVAPFGALVQLVKGKWPSWFSFEQTTENTPDAATTVDPYREWLVEQAVLPRPNESGHEHSMRQACIILKQCKDVRDRGPSPPNVHFQSPRHKRGQISFGIYQAAKELKQREEWDKEYSDRKKRNILDDRVDP